MTSIAHDIVSDILDLAERTLSPDILASALRIHGNMLKLSALTEAEHDVLIARAEALTEVLEGIQRSGPWVPFVVFDAEATTHMSEA